MMDDVVSVVLPDEQLTNISVGQDIDVTRVWQDKSYTVPGVVIEVWNNTVYVGHNVVGARIKMAMLIPELVCWMLCVLCFEDYYEQGTEETQAT